jgi:DNA-binding GntR family transcriptional regulator
MVIAVKTADWYNFPADEDRFPAERCAMPPIAVYTATRAEYIADTLRDAIRIGGYLSGERLVELTLAQEMTVSQNTIRDALRILEQEGWVIKHPRRGVYVRTFTREEVRELCTLVETLESLVLEWAIESLTRDSLKQLCQIIDRAGQQMETLEWQGVLNSIDAFHQALLKIANKPQTAELLTRLLNQTCLLENIREMRSPRGLPGWNWQIKAYHALLKALESHDVSAAQKTLSVIRKTTCGEVLACL